MLLEPLVLAFKFVDPLVEVPDLVSLAAHIWVPRKVVGAVRDLQIYNLDRPLSTKLIKIFILIY